MRTERSDRMADDQKALDAIARRFSEGLDLPADACRWILEDPTRLPLLPALVDLARLDRDKPRPRASPHLRALLTSLHGAAGSDPFTTRDVLSLAVPRRALSDALAPIVDGKDYGNALGRFLRAQCECPVAGLRLVLVGEREGANLFAIKTDGSDG